MNAKDDQPQPKPPAEECAEGEAPKEALSPEEELKEENRFLVDQLQRARAELENFKRRTRNEQAALRRRMVVDVFRQILPLFDDLQIALAQDADPGPLSEGLQLIVDKFSKLLREHSIEVIPTVGNLFDPSWHEAMYTVESSEYPDGHIMEELERGYRLGDVLIRPARVKVAKIAQPDSTENPGSLGRKSDSTGE